MLEGASDVRAIFLGAVGAPAHHRDPGNKSYRANRTQHQAKQSNNSKQTLLVDKQIAYLTTRTI
jgi:hypothetical protein